MKSLFAVLCVALVAAVWAEEEAALSLDTLRNWITNIGKQVQDAVNGALDSLANLVSSTGDKSKEAVARISELIKDLEQKLDEAQAKATQAANDAQAKLAAAAIKQIEQQIQRMKDIEAKLKETLGGIQ